jgi:8-oxo-dGTP pyrophosphatase MutT (NUDIX family)
MHKNTEKYKGTKEKLEEIERTVRSNTPRPIGRYGYSSVLIPLIEADQTLRVLFEVRSDELRKQPGEIAFPGGKIEPGESPETCAIRETSEEIGIPESKIEVLGELNYIVSYSNFTMYCFLGRIDARDLAAAKPNPAEVKAMFTVPLAFFLENKPEVYINEIRPVIAENFPQEKIHFKEGYSWRTGTSTVPIYSYTEEDGTERVIWGLTARLISDFAEMLCGVPAGA